MCFVWIWEQTAIISLYNINWLVFITKTECVYCAVWTGSVCVLDQTSLCLQLCMCQIYFLSRLCSFACRGLYFWRTALYISSCQWKHFEQMQRASYDCLCCLYRLTQNEINISASLTHLVTNYRLLSLEKDIWRHVFRHFSSLSWPLTPPRNAVMYNSTKRSDIECCAALCRLSVKLGPATLFPVTKGQDKIGQQDHPQRQIHTTG